MLRKSLFPTLLALTALVLLLAGCSQEATSPLAPLDDDEALDKVPGAKPSVDEITDLLFIREEEKMARDVYLVLGPQFNLNIMANISTSEQKHMTSVLVLLDRYLLIDPVGENGIGEFTSEVIQDLYDSLIASGGVSPADALLAGLQIEETDILDLQAAMDRAVLPDIDKVYSKLCDGSKNHLRSFVGDYETLTGETYVPRWLSQEAFDEIMEVVPDHGGNGGHWRTSF